jgi:type II secretion system protein N
MRIDWSQWKPRLLYGAFFLAALVLALRWTFPAGAVQERIALEAAARGWRLEAAEAGPAGLVGLSLRDVTLKDRAGLTIPIDRVDLSLRLWPLLTGKLRVAVVAWLYDGKVSGSLDLSAGPRQYLGELRPARCRCGWPRASTWPAWRRDRPSCWCPPTRRRGRRAGWP